MPLYVHRLVASAFLGELRNASFVNHKDGDKRNNQPGNLEFVTNQQNLRHAVRLGLIKSGEQAPNSKLSLAKAREIREAHASGIPAKSLAHDYGVHVHTIRLVVNQKTWTKNKIAEATA